MSMEALRVLQQLGPETTAKWGKPLRDWERAPLSVLDCMCAEHVPTGLHVYNEKQVAIAVTCGGGLRSISIIDASARAARPSRKPPPRGGEPDPHSQ